MKKGIGQNQYSIRIKGKDIFFKEAAIVLKAEAWPRGIDNFKGANLFKHSSELGGPFLALAFTGSIGL